MRKLILSMTLLVFAVVVMNANTPATMSTNTRMTTNSSKIEVSTEMQKSTCPVCEEINRRLEKLSPSALSAVNYYMNKIKAYRKAHPGVISHEKFDRIYLYFINRFEHGGK
jgi:hypothetical protein